MYECTNGCCTLVARRGMCPDCAAQRRQAADVAGRRIAEIRIKCAAELPQHVEPVAPVRTREIARLRVVAAPEEAAEVREAPEVAADVAPAPPVAVARPTPRKGGAYRRGGEAAAAGRPLRAMELDPAAREGWCRILGCGRTSQARGLCSSCYWVATHREGLDHLMLPARRRHGRIDEGAAIRGRVLAAVEGTPGIGPGALATGLVLPISSVKHHLRRLVVDGLIVADHRGTYRAAGAAAVAARNATDRLEELVRARGRIRRSEAAAILEMSEKTMQSAVNNLRLRGRLLAPGKGKAATWLEVAR